MKGITKRERWDPFEDLFGLRTRPWEEMFDMPARLERLTPRALVPTGMLELDWTPATNIVETRDKFILRAELPGMEEKDVHIELEGRLLTINGERKFEKKTEDENYHRIESSYGKFYRSFTLPHDVEESRIEANFDNGVLTIEVPKVEGAKPKQIPISGRKKIKAS